MIADDVIRSNIQDIRSNILPHQNIANSKSNYILTHMHLAQLYCHLKEYKKVFYHLTECHGTLLRQYAILEDIRREGCFGVSLIDSSLQWKYLSSTSEYAKLEDEGVLRRLSEMPSEWTIVQITRIPGNKDYLIAPDSCPELKELFVSRVQGGPNPDEILVAYTDLPNISVNVLDVFNKAAEMLAIKTGNHAAVVRSRNTGSKTIQKTVTTLDDDLFMDWKCIFLGKLEDSVLENSIRSRICNILSKFNVEIPSNIKQLIFLLAEGVHFFKPILIWSCITKNFPDDKNFKVELYDEILHLKDLFPVLERARRHPVILIIDDHSDIIPWECMEILKDQAVTRVSSIHFLHALFMNHKNHINCGLREIAADKINYYVVNPDGNLPMSEARLKPFFEARLPTWHGFIHELPTPEQMVEVLTKSNTYVYCGHGSGAHLINNMNIQKLKLTDSVQLLFGCKSGALKYLGGTVPMMGDMLHYCIAGSACSLGMLFTVTSNDADNMAICLANLWLPGTPINPTNYTPLSNTLKNEPELLRVIPSMRQEVQLFSNGAALISRGLPVKIVPSKN